MQVVKYIATLAAVIWCSLGAAQDLKYSGDFIATTSFMADLAELYKATEGASVSLDLTSTTEAIRMAASGEVDMAGTGRSPRSTERQERRAAVYPVVWDALVVIVNRENPINNLGVSELMGIFQGNITNWQQVGGPEQPITFVRESDALAAVNYQMAELMLGSTQGEFPPSEQFENLVEVHEFVETNPWAMAITSYSAARNLRTKMLAINLVSPGVNSIQSGDYFFYVPVYLAIREDGRNRRDVRDFLRFVSGSSAKRVLRRNGVVPYTEGIALASRQVDRVQTLDQMRRASE